MNKTLIALAVSAAAVATGAHASADGIQAGGIEGTSVYSSNGNSLEIGGRAEARMSLKDGKAEDKTRVRLNFLGKTQINDNLYGLGFYEAEYNANDNATDGDKNDIDHRYTYAGIGGNFGEVTYGKNDGALGVITDFTDIMSYHGNTAAYKLVVADRTDNMLSYKGQFEDLGLKASYRFADRVEDTVNGGYTDNETDGYSLSAIYAIGDTGVKLGGGYADQDTGASKSSDQYMLAASYRISDFYFAGTFTDGQDKDGSSKTDKTGYEFAAAYTLEKVAFTTTYNKLEEKTSGTTYDAADNVAIDATYYFKPNFRTYISYNFNLLGKDDKTATGTVGKAGAEDELALGLRYDF
ncbi:MULTISPECIES: porin [Vibrio]|uniref:Porin domain-containing protein n=1 Tax=Vibrio bivalvicida TaxID=1276888 RepID=A0A177Y677_9VIBR|nr:MULTISPECIES: porin [Vibrio]KLN64198.1 membrane protein [Vibrio sp. VPAP30]OAJ96025.1 hypothetical protein APB76_01670 [Vibrio bivalvicida]